MPGKTTNFNWVIPVASDLWNQLTLGNPAIEAIDAQAFKNQNAGVQTASHTRLGTVHALVRDIKTAPVIRFVATENYHTLDTFTLDGENVSARLPDGTALQEGCFKTGNNVLCIMGSGVLTFFLPGKDWSADVNGLSSSVGALTKATEVEKITLTAEQGFTFTGECFRVGRTVTINGTITGTFTANFNNQGILDMPLKYCPTKDFGAPATLYGEGYVFGSGFMNVRKRSNGLSGAIGIVSNTPNTTTAYVSATWLLAELPG